MKIPSTKRVCLVGSQQGKVDLEMLKTLVNCDRQSFVPRQKLEKVRKSHLHTTSASLSSQELSQTGRPSRNALPS